MISRLESAFKQGLCLLAVTAVLLVALPSIRLRDLPLDTILPAELGFCALWVFGRVRWARRRAATAPERMKPRRRALPPAPNMEQE